MMSPRTRHGFLGFRFSKPQLLQAALIHPSYRNEHPHVPLPDFDRLEFFGDAVLNYVICSELYKLLPEANEGVLSRLRSSLVSRKILARVAREIRLFPHLKLGKGLQKERGAQQDKILADSLEAFIAALYEDQGLETARQFILKRFRPYLNPRRIVRLDPNPKSTLQELSQKLWRTLPRYSWQSARKGIRVTVRVGKKHVVTVTGKNRRELEKKGALALLRKLRGPRPSRPHPTRRAPSPKRRLHPSSS